MVFQQQDRKDYNPMEFWGEDYEDRWNKRISQWQETIKPPEPPKPPLGTRVLQTISGLIKPPPTIETRPLPERGPVPELPVAARGRARMTAPRPAEPSGRAAALRGLAELAKKGPTAPVDTVTGAAPKVAPERTGPLGALRERFEKGKEIAEQWDIEDWKPEEWKPPAGSPMAKFEGTKVGAFITRLSQKAGEVFTMSPSKFPLPTTGKGAADQIADAIGTVVGFIAPSGGPQMALEIGNQAAYYAAPKIASKLGVSVGLVQKALSGGVGFGILGGARAEELKDVPKEAAKGAAVGTAGGVASHFAGPMANTITRKLGVPAETATERIIESMHTTGTRLASMSAGYGIIEGKPAEDIAKDAGVAYGLGMFLGLVQQAYPEAKYKIANEKLKTADLIKRIETIEKAGAQRVYDESGNWKAGHWVSPQGKPIRVIVDYKGKAYTLDQLVDRSLWSKITSFDFGKLPRGVTPIAGQVAPAPGVIGEAAAPAAPAAIETPTRPPTPAAPPVTATATVSPQVMQANIEGAKVRYADNLRQWVFAGSPADREPVPEEIIPAHEAEIVKNAVVVDTKVAPESPVTQFEEPSKVIGRPEVEKPPEAKPGAIETKPVEPTETVQKPEKPTAPATKPAAIEEGQTVYNQKGEPLTVVDVSDPSLLTVRNARGTEFKTGRKSVTVEKPAAPAETVPKAEAEKPLAEQIQSGDYIGNGLVMGEVVKEGKMGKTPGWIIRKPDGKQDFIAKGDPDLTTVGGDLEIQRAQRAEVAKPAETKPETKPVAKITAYSERKSVDTETGKEITIREEHRIRKNNEKLMDELKAKGYPLDAATRPIVEERRYVRDGKPGPWEVFDTHKTRKAALEQMAAAKLTPVSSEYKKYVAGEEAKEAAIKAEREKEAEKKRRFQEMVSRISGETPVTKMKRGKIQVVLSEGEKTEPFTAYKVSENVYIHKSLEGGKPSRKQDAKWTVTLHPSGVAMGTRYSKEDAIAWATALSRSGIDLSLDVKGLKSQIDKVKKLGEAFRRGEMPTPPSKKVKPPKDKGIDLQLFAELKKVNPKWTDKERRDITKMIQKLRKVDTKQLRPEYKREIEGLLKDIDLQVFRRTKKKLHRLENTRKFLETHSEAVLPDKIMKELSILDKRRLSEMTREQIQDVYTAVMHFAHLNKLKNKLTIGNRLKDVRKVSHEAVELVKQAKPNLKGLGEDIKQISSLVTDKGPGRIKRVWTTRSYLPELMTHMLQGKEQGPISQFMYDGINEGYNRKLEVYFSAHDHLQKAIGDTNIDGWSRIFNKKARDVEVVKVELTDDRSIEMTRDDRMEIYLHTKNPHNMRSLVKGGVRFKTSEGTKHKFTEEDIALIVKSMSPSEKRIADAMFEYLNTQQKIDVNNTSVRLNGYEIATVENYWPVSRSEIDYKRDPQKELKVFSYRALENMGLLQERKKVTMPLVVRGAFQTFLTNIEDASSYVGLAEPLRNAKTLIQDGRFISELRNRGLGEHYKTLRKYLEYVEGAVGNQSEMDRMALDVLGKFQTAKLALNPWVVMKQPVSYLVAGTEMDSKYLIKATATKVNWNEIKKYDPQLRYRVEAGAVDREMGELARVGVGKWFYTGKTFTHRKLTGLIQKADAMAVGRIWNAAKLEIKDKHPDLKGDAFFKKVSERTQQIVNRTQPTFLPHTRSEINRDPSTFWRLFTMFSNQRNKNYNMMIRSWWKYQNSGHTASDKANFMKSLFLVMVASPFILMGIDELRDKLYKRDTKKSFLGRAVKMVSINLSNMYFVGTVFDSIVSKVEQGTWAGYDIDNPIEGLLNQGVGAISDTVAAIDQIVKGEKYTSGARKGEDKWKITALRAMDKAAGLIAELQGYPYQNVTSLAKGITKHLSPESEFAVDALTRNPQPSDYYKKLWEAYMENDIKRSQQLLELMIEQFDTKWDGVKSSAGYKELSIAEKKRLAKLFIEASKKARQ